jgi:type IV pilus assembly protein PilX
MNKVTHQLPRLQRGVVLIFSLIVLLILTIGAVALMRSMNSSLFSAGNLAFRRDLVNQGEQAVSNVMAEFRAGGALSSASLTDADAKPLNYKSTALVTNPQGVPTALLNTAAFNAVGVAANDIAGRTPDVQIRYVIDRLCGVTGVTISTQCVQSTAVPNSGTGGRNLAVIAPTSTVYRVSVRVSGPRNTQIFLQSTFTRPD